MILTKMFENFNFHMCNLFEKKDVSAGTELTVVAWLTITGIYIYINPSANLSFEQLTILYKLCILDDTHHLNSDCLLLHESLALWYVFS